MNLKIRSHIESGSTALQLERVISHADAATDQHSPALETDLHEGELIGCGAPALGCEAESLISLPSTFWPYPQSRACLPGVTSLSNSLHCHRGNLLLTARLILYCGGDAIRHMAHGQSATLLKLTTESCCVTQAHARHAIICCIWTHIDREGFGIRSFIDDAEKARGGRRSCTSRRLTDSPTRLADRGR
jgi:hypothetical protein